MTATSRRRVLRILRFLRSPKDGSELRLDEDGILRDRGGNVFPVLDGVPVLVPDLDAVLLDHYRLSTDRSAGHAAFARPSRQILHSVRSEPLKAYLFGIHMDIRALEPFHQGLPEVPERLRMPGTLLETGDGRPYVVASDGTLLVTSLHLSHGYLSLENWTDLRERIPLEPPFLLTAEPYPDMVFSNYFEMVLFMRPEDMRAILTAAKKPAAASAPGPAAGSRCLEATPLEEGPEPAAKAWDLIPLGAENLPYFRHIVRTFDLDLERKAVLDVGCGDGFLVKAFENLGAAYPIGTDIRFSGLRGCYGSESGAGRSVLGMADMFEWSYAKEAFSLITLRNNSAFAKAKAFDERFVRFGKAMLDSLAEGGLIYLSFLTNGSGRVEGEGFTNPTLRETAAYLRRMDAAWVRMMKLGTYTCLLLCRQEDYARVKEKERRATYAQRRRALRDYMESGARADTTVLRNFFLAVADHASEVAQAAIGRGKPSYLLWGGGVLGYYLWKLCAVFYPEMSCAGFVRTREPGADGGIWPKGCERIRAEYAHLREVTPAEAQGELRHNTVSALVDADVLPREWPPDNEEGLVFFPPGESPDAQGGRRRRAGGEPWQYHYASGDHDLSLPASITEAYLEGPLAVLGGKDSGGLKLGAKRFLRRFLPRRSP